MAVPDNSPAYSTVVRRRIANVVFH